MCYVHEGRAAALRETPRMNKSPDAKKEKGLGIAEALLFLCCAAGRAVTIWPTHRSSHRESGVLSFVVLLSPVESSIPSGAQGAHS